MRFLVILAFVLFAVGNVSSKACEFKHFLQNQNDEPPKAVCLVCSGLVKIPEHDTEAQILLKLACDSIQNSIGSGACRFLAGAIHKTHTWPVFKWLLDRMKGITCALIC